MALYEINEFLTLNDVAEYLADKCNYDFNLECSTDQNRLIETIIQLVRNDKLHPVFHYRGNVDWLKQKVITRKSGSFINHERVLLDITYDMSVRDYYFVNGKNFDKLIENDCSNYINVINCTIEPYHIEGKQEIYENNILYYRKVKDDFSITFHDLLYPKLDLAKIFDQTKAKKTIKDNGNIERSSQQLIDVQEKIAPLATDYDDMQAPHIIYPAEHPKDNTPHTNLGKYQKELITYDVFTPIQIACLILNYPPESSSTDREFISCFLNIDAAINAGELTISNRENHINSQQVKVWLARNNYVYKDFNDNIPADPIAQVRQLTTQLADAQATIKQITNNYEKALARIEAKEQSADSFKMGSPTVEQGEPKTSEQIVSEFREQIIQLTADNNELKKKLKTVHIELKAAKTSQPSDDDKELAYKSQTKVACMLYAILKENNYDLSPPMGKGLANDLIVNASQVHGTPVTKNFVADWLKRANQAKINLTNK